MPCILVIDDEPAVLESLRQVLKHRGFGVLTASSSAQGVKVARERGPDLILCDLTLRGADGLSILNAIRHDPKIAGIPFFVMTGWPDSGVERQVVEGGADGFLVKPFSTQELYATIQSRLDKALAGKQH